MLDTDTSQVAALLMAGGSGTRLWPISRRGRAKQFAPLLGTKTLLEMTYERVRTLLPDARVFVNVTAGNEDWVHRLLPSVPRSNVIAAPDDRDTLPTLGHATLAIEQLVSSPTMLILASDNWIGDVAPLHTALLDAIDAAQRGPHLVSVGIRPSCAATQYGYMHVGARAPFGAAAYFGLGYREKPTAEVAEQLVAGGAHDWNSGMFAWSARTFWEAVRAFAPQDADVFDELRERRHALAPDDRRALFGRLRKIAVDHALLENIGPTTREKHVFVRADVDWDDVGHYAALARYLPEDDHGNRIRGEVSAVNTRGCTLLCDAGTTLDVRGIDDLIVASDSGDVLIASRASYGSVRQLSEVDLWPGIDGAGEGSSGNAGNQLLGFVKVLDARNCTVASCAEGVVALVGVEGLHVRVRPGRVEVSLRQPIARRTPPGEAAFDGVAHGDATQPMRASPPRVALTVADDEERMSSLAAAHIVARIQALLGARGFPLVMFSAGRTPLGLFRLLRSVHRHALDWSRVRVAQMDEYAEVANTHSFAHALRTEVVDPLGVQQFWTIDSSWTRHQLVAYEQRLASERLDLVVHGIGANGHLGFNEPGVALDGSADVVALAATTRERARSWFGSASAPPERGLTVGLRVLNAAHEVVLLAAGAAKAAALRDALFGPVDPRVPASSLQCHDHVSVFTDRHAARGWLGGAPS